MDLTSYLTCMKSGTKEKSWKYSSSLSFKVSLFVREKAYGDVIFSIIVKGVMMVFFSLTLILNVVHEYEREYLGQCSLLTVAFPHQSPSRSSPTWRSTTYSRLDEYPNWRPSQAHRPHYRESLASPYEHVSLSWCQWWIRPTWTGLTWSATGFHWVQVWYHQLCYPCTQVGAYLLKVILKVVLCKGFIFWRVRSLQINIIGI